MDVAKLAELWVISDYLPGDRRPRVVVPVEIERLREALPNVTVAPLPVPRDCTTASWPRCGRSPRRCSTPDLRRATSASHQVSPEGASSALEALRADLESGRWDERHGHLREQPEHDVGLRIVTATAGNLDEHEVRHRVVELLAHDRPALALVEPPRTAVGRRREQRASRRTRARAPPPRPPRAARAPAGAPVRAIDDQVPRRCASDRSSTGRAAIAAGRIVTCPTTRPSSSATAHQTRRRRASRAGARPRPRRTGAPNPAARRTGRPRRRRRTGVRGARRPRPSLRAGQPSRSATIPPVTPR